MCSRLLDFINVYPLLLIVIQQDYLVKGRHQTTLSSHNDIGWRWEYRHVDEKPMESDMLSLLRHDCVNLPIYISILSVDSKH
jgi:hypothetical protein